MRNDLFICISLRIDEVFSFYLTQQTEAEIQVVRARQNVSIVMIVLAAAILLFILVTVNLFNKRLQSFLAQLEKTTADYVRERRKNEHLMVQILPVGVAKRLVSSSHVEPEVFKSATVYFSDIYHFTELTADLHPVDLIKVLNAVYRVIDDGIEAHAAYKAETIGNTVKPGTKFLKFCWYCLTLCILLDFLYILM